MQTQRLIAQAQLGDNRALGITPEDLRQLSQEQMIDMVMALQRQPILRRTTQGIRQGVVQLVRLRLGHEIMQFQQKDGTPIGQPFITAKGYYRLAAAMGFTIQTAKTVIVDGEEQGNPYLMRDPETGMVESIYVRKIVIGRNPHGNLVARDQTVIFSPWAYLVEDLHSREKWQANKGAIEGTAFVLGERPNEAGHAFIAEVKLPGGAAIGMKINAADDIVRGVLKSYAGRLKKAVEIAQTFADRNALKKVLGVPESPPLYNGDAYIPVVCWMQPDQQFTEINNAIDVLEGDGITVEVETDTEQMTGTDAAAIAVQVADVGDVVPGSGGWTDGDVVTAEAEAAAAESVPDQTQPPTTSIHDEVHSYEADPLTWVTWMITRGNAYAEDLGAERFAEICTAAGTDDKTWANHGQETMRAVIEACENALNGDQTR